MAKLEQLEGLAQTEIIVIPMIDVSGSMSGERIASVNDAMQDVPEELKDINDSLIDTRLLIAPMEFSSGARWFSLANNAPAEVESFRWIDMKANGLTDMGAAFKLLAEKLTVEEKGGWMNGRGGVAPVIILISDGEPTDDYQKELANLKRRGWFKAALKFAVAVEGANKNILAEFTGNMEAVIDTTTIKNDLASIIKTVVVTASKCQSESGSKVTSDDNNASVTDEDAINQVQQDAINQVQNSLSLDDDDLF